MDVCLMWSVIVILNTVVILKLHCFQCDQRFSWGVLSFRVVWVCFGWFCLIVLFPVETRVSNLEHPGQFLIQEDLERDFSSAFLLPSSK